MVWLGDLAKVEKSGVEVLQGHAALGGAAGLGHAGDATHEHGIGGLLPEGAFLPVVFFGEVKSVVGDEDDDGVVLVGAFGQGLENAAVLRIDVSGGGEVGLHC